MRIPRAAALGLLLAASGAAAQPGVQYKRWNDVSGSALSYLDTDPDYYTQLDNPDVERVLLDLFEAPVNVWCAHAWPLSLPRARDSARAHPLARSVA